MDTVVRASSLSSYPDCPRRWAARHLRDLVDAAGYRVRQLPSSIGAHVGSGTHAAISHDLTHKIEHGAFGDWSETEQRGIQELEDRIGQDGVMWDDVSPTMSDAQLQVRRLAKTYRAQVGGAIRPVAVERRLKGRHHSGLVLSGQQDVVVTDPAGLEDTKTGKRQASNWAQYGSYARLLRSHGQPIAEIRERYIARVPLKKEQPPVVTIDYPIDACEAQAEQVLIRIAADIASFKRSGNRDAFLANPSSSLCGEKWCPAWGTAFCPLGRRR